MLYSLSISLGVASSLKIVSGRLGVGLTSGLTSEVGPTSRMTSEVGPTSELTSGVEPTSELTSGVEPTSELAPTLVKGEVAQCLTEVCQILQLGVALKEAERFPSSP